MSKSENTEETASAEKPAKATKTARVSVLKKIQYGNHICAPGHEIPEMDLEEVKLRAASGEILLIKVN